MNKGEWNLNGTASDESGPVGPRRHAYQVRRRHHRLRRQDVRGIGSPGSRRAELHRFIGPAIIESLRRNHVPEDELDRAVTIYRSYYADRAVFDDPNEPGNKVPGRLVNVVFPGIREQLLKLRADGYYLALASCKPEYQCVPICEHFHLTELLDGIYGASRDNSRLDKDQVIRYCFDKIGFDAAAGDKAVMIGDRYTDIDAPTPAIWTPLAAAGATLRPVRWKNTVPTKSSRSPSRSKKP